jgi:hypothetical protein
MIAAQKTDYLSRLLRTHYGHPCGGAHEDHDEMPSPHSITSSATDTERPPKDDAIISNTEGACKLHGTREG